MNLTPAEMVLRCYAKKEQGKWQAYCLDLCLAAQADTFEDAKRKLKEQIATYVYDAVAGPDQEHADYLLNRTAPLWFVLKYDAYVILQHVGGLGGNVRRVFKEVIPLIPQVLAVPPRALHA
jgi:predicted RNase H-like HicB family nuclease